MASNITTSSIDRHFFDSLRGESRKLVQPYDEKQFKSIDQGRSDYVHYRKLAAENLASDITRVLTLDKREIEAGEFDHLIPIPKQLASFLDNLVRAEKLFGKDEENIPKALKSVVEAKETLVAWIKQSVYSQQDVDQHREIKDTLLTGD